MTYYERNLPHWQPEGKAPFVTWRLWGSLPALVWAKTKAGLDVRSATRPQARGQECPRHQRPSAGEYFLAMDRELDKGARGLAWLSDARVARAVVATLHRGEHELGQYRLHAFVVMPNHVHILHRRRKK